MSEEREHKKDEAMLDEDETQFLFLGENSALASREVLVAHAILFTELEQMEREALGARVAMISVRLTGICWFWNITS